MKRIAIDMDETIADAIQKVRSLYEKEVGRRFSDEELHGKTLREVFPPEHRDKLKEYLHSAGFFRDLHVLPDSQEVIYALTKKYEVYITSAAMEFRTCFTDKFDWLAEHFPFIPWQNIVFCGDKSIIRADFLIDDHARHFKGFGGQGILFTSPHNVHETGYPRVNNWREVAAMFLG
ncbi:5'-3'-deoxyribonucleotidase [soil metagenome]